MREFGAERQPVASSAVWEEVVKRLPLDGEEAEVLSGASRQRGWVDWNWRVENLAKAGWIVRDSSGNGQWSLTPGGVAALDAHPGPTEFDAEANRIADDVRRKQAETREERLATEIVPQDVRQEKVIRAAREFVESVLKAGESMFVPGRLIWTQENLLAVRERLTAGPREIAGGFDEKIADQFANSSDDVKLLVAELATVQVLPISGAIGERRKAGRVGRILSSMARPVEVPAVFQAAFTGGSFHPGQAMATDIPGAINVIISVLLEWISADSTTQQELLDDPKSWREFVLAAPGMPFPSQRDSLMYLVHPSYFGPIVSEKDKLAIREAFAGEIEELSGNVDQDLRDITIALQVKSQKQVDFYSDPLQARWVAPNPPVPSPPTPDPAPHISKTLNDLAADLHLHPAWLQSTVELVRSRRQVIFSGPPGTGKTYLARSIGRFLAKEEGAFEIVQFHPSYSYEDFFEGFRPDPSQSGAAFSLQAGPFRRLAERARINPEFAYVLVIDEINRGNLSKIFGELYFLLEYRDEAITLLYGGGSEDASDGGARFRLPANVHIIGTMNTADRSIALLDAAMRRRFSFVELHPDREPVSDMFEAWLEGRPMGPQLSRLLKDLNALIPDDAFKVGPSYFMKEDMTPERLRTTWQYDILPLLSELHYGDGTDVASRYDLDKLLATSAATDPDA